MQFLFHTQTDLLSLTVLRGKVPETSYTLVNDQNCKFFCEQSIKLKQLLRHWRIQRGLQGRDAHPPLLPLSVGGGEGGTMGPIYLLVTR